MHLRGRIDRTWQLMGWEHPESGRPYSPWVCNLGGSVLSQKTGESPGTGLCVTTVELEIMASGS